MSKKTRVKTILLGVMMLMISIVIINTVSRNNSPKYVPPTNGEKAVHYALGDSIKVENLEFSVDELIALEDYHWQLRGDINEEALIQIKNNYTFMMGVDNIVIQNSTSLIKNENLLVVKLYESKDFNQIMLIDNRSGNILAVINLNERIEFK